MRQSFAAAYAGEEDWSGKVADPGRDHIFDDLVYTRGAMTLQALRTTIGDDASRACSPGGPSPTATATSPPGPFIQFVERLTHRDLDGFLHTWLYQPGKPTL